MVSSTTDDEPPLSEVTATLAPAYRTLAALYLEPPTAERIEALRAWCSAVDTDGFPEAATDAIETVDSADVDLDELRGAFTRLFQGVGYGSELPPPPYESLYVDGVLNGPSSSEVEAFYLETGVKLAVDDELIDHAGYELAFLAELCERDRPDYQYGFIETHVGEWLPEFHAETESNDLPAFYRGVFALTEAILELHVDTLEEHR